MKDIVSKTILIAALGLMLLQLSFSFFMNSHMGTNTHCEIESNCILQLKIDASEKLILPFFQIFVAIVFFLLASTSKEFLTKFKHSQIVVPYVRRYLIGVIQRE